MFWGNVKAWYREVKLRDKIFINYLLLCIFPLITVSILTYQVSVSNTRESMADFVELFSSQLNSEIESQIASIDNITKAIINDVDILKFLSHEEEYLLSERIKNRRIVDGYIYNMILQKPDVKRIVILGTSKTVYHSDSVDKRLASSDFEKEPWFDKLLNSGGNLIITPAAAGTPSEDNRDWSYFIIGRSLKDVHGTVHGIILFEVKLENIIRTNLARERIMTQYDIAVDVYNANNENIYHRPSESLPENSTEDDAIVISSRAENYGLNISIRIPKKTLFSKLNLLKNLTYVFVIGMIFLTLVLSYLLGYNITRPLSDLAKGMKQLQNRQYNFLFSPDRNDEIGTLIKTYNQMVSRINTLINEVYVTKLKERKAQFVALQNQLNPHMLYNTIESIRMRAELQNAPEISEMVKNLGKIFRLTLSKGKPNHTVRDEIEYIVTYTSLMNIRYNNRYTLEIDLSDEILEAPITRFAFQPIVENCIIHGFKNMQSGCVIRIGGLIKPEGILLSIADNGAGMDVNRLATVKKKLAPIDAELDEINTGIGLQNVYDRIKLEYGEEYGMDIHSALMDGTVVEILIPYGKR